MSFSKAEAIFLPKLIKTEYVFKFLNLPFLTWITLTYTFFVFDFTCMEWYISKEFEWIPVWW